MIDSHCHLDFSDFDKDRNDIIQRCKKNGMQALVLPGYSPKQWEKAQALCAKDSFYYYGVGLHPWYVGELSTPWNSDSFTAKLIEAASHSKCIAIGECGLDKIKSHSKDNWLLQNDVFNLHCDLAQKLQKPLIIHSVKSHEAIMHTLSHYNNVKGVIHAFHGSYEQAKRFCSKGFYLGAGGGITYLRAKKTRDAFRLIPLENIVLETDAPSMPLFSKQGVRNTPENLYSIAQELATIKGVSIDVVLEQTTLNTKQLFNLV